MSAHFRPAPGPPTSRILSTPSRTTRAEERTPATQAPAAADATRSNKRRDGRSPSRSQAGISGPLRADEPTPRSPGGTPHNPSNRWLLSSVTRCRRPQASGSSRSPSTSEKTEVREELGGGVSRGDDRIDRGGVVVFGAWLVNTSSRDSIL